MSHDLRAAGVDVGASAVKAVIVGRRAGTDVVLAVAQDRIRRRDPRLVIDEVLATARTLAGSEAGVVGYLASTGEGELVGERDAHFYGMTTHARGGLFLCPAARAVLDLGGLHARAIRMDERGKVESYRMTSQCASGSGQFLENIARYLGVALDEVGALSKTAEQPETISGICAVLAETDVINMVSRGISTANILRGIHDSMAKRFVKLLRASGVEGTVIVTGGLAADAGLVAAMGEAAAASGRALQLVTHPWSVYAGAIGAALWGLFRQQKLTTAERPWPRAEASLV